MRRVQGSGFRVQGSGFRVQGSAFSVQGSGFRVQCAGFRVQNFSYRQCYSDPGMLLTPTDAAVEQRIGNFRGEGFRDLRV